ncbi:MAG: MMPL family transporter [Oscillospiraceae bacterium]|nr:MMPL family transporter [Oscillospiraceae bacterium]
MNKKPSPLHRASEWIVDHYRLFFIVFAVLLVFSAVASGWVKVENDVAAYLPADSEVRQGLDIMEQEFQTYGSAKILLRDTDADTAAAMAEQIRAVDGVDSCTYTMNDAGSALLSVSLSDLEGSDACAQTVQALRDLLDGSGAYIYSTEGYSISDQINGEVRGLLVIVAIILVTVLTFTSSTYAEVPILLITFLAAALINKGTNFVFGTISFVSNAVAILLQLAMSVDYAIIFCNRYKQAHETLPVREAVIESLAKSITVISSSSLTTIAGLVAMTFMKFGLGRDLGIVLIKAILISLMTVFLLTPGLLLKLGPAMDKTKHRNFVPKISGVGRLAWRTRRVVPLVFAAVLVVACVGVNRVSYVYSEAPLKTHNADANRTASQAITADFGDETVLAVVVPAGDYDQEAALLDALSAVPEVKSAVGIAGTEAAGGYRLADAVDYRTFAQLSGVDSTSAQALFALYAAENGAAQTAAQDLRGYQVPLLKLFEFLNDKIADGTVTLSDAQAAQVTVLSDQLARASAQLEGASYHRLVLTLAAASDGDETFALLDRIHAVVHQYYPTDSYLVGDAMSAYGSEQTFTQDNVMVSAMSILMVMLVLLFTFRSLGMPILLTLVIQGSIWINFGITVLTGEYVLFMVYLVASAIQMGCNVDYAIVVASHYTEARADQGPREAMITALNLAFPTIITSGTMLISAGLLIGARVSSGAVAGMGRFVGVGSLITVFLVLFVLPQLLLLGDTFVRRTALPAQRRLPLTSASRAARWVLLAAAVFVMAVSPWSAVRTQQERADRVEADTQLCGSARSLGELAASLGAQQETYDALKLSFATGVVTDNVGQSQLQSGQAEYDAGSEKLAAAKAQYAAGQAQLEQGKADYAAGQAQLARIQPVYDAVHPAYQRYLDRQAEYDAAVADGDLARAALLWPGVTAQKQLYETQLLGTGYSIESLVQAYEAGQAKLSEGAVQIAAAEQQLQDAQAQLVAGQQALDAAAAEIAAGQSKLDTAAGTLASGRQTLAANRQQLAQDLAELAPYEDDTERLEQGIAVLMQGEALRTRAGSSASYGDICALAQDLYAAEMNTARTEAAAWTGICIVLFAAGVLALVSVCLGHRRGKAAAWCTALAAILSVGCLIAMLAAGHGALRTLCLCAALALLVLAFVAAGLTLRQRAAKAQ